MRKVREILRLTLGEGVSKHLVAAALGIPRTTVRNCVSCAMETGVTWPLPEGMDDGALEQLLDRGPDTAVNRPEDDWACQALHRCPQAIRRTSPCDQ